METLRATSAMPFVSKMVEIDGKKYPNLVQTINNRYQNYNKAVEKIIDMENKKEIFVIRPSRKVDIKRIERDENKLQEMYDLGTEDGKNKLEELKKFLNYDNMQ